MEARPEAAGDDATEAADQGAAPAVRAAQARARWVLPAAWSCLGALVVALVALAVFLLFRMDLFADEPLTDEKIKSLWAFLGVALGAAATVIGALLTDQNSRRSATLAKEAEERAKRALDQQIAQDHETATRLTLDTRARVLELITYEGDYAPKARVAGALATLMELRGGPVACRILDELWRRDKIGTSSAVWIVERVSRRTRRPPTRRRRRGSWHSTRRRCSRPGTARTRTGTTGRTSSATGGRRRSRRVRETA